MKEEEKNDKWLKWIKPTKTRQEICYEYDISYKVFVGKIAFHKIILPSGFLLPINQIEIYDAFGEPLRFLRDEKG
jgi:hypothetical protein